MARPRRALDLHPLEQVWVLQEQAKVDLYPVDSLFEKGTCLWTLEPRQIVAAGLEERQQHLVLYSIEIPSDLQVLECMVR